jgi:4-carboxymuconolactone decarboxylase
MWCLEKRFLCLLDRPFTLDVYGEQDQCRPGLDPTTKCVLKLAMISVLNRLHEAKTQLKGELNNRVSKDEVTEVLPQIAIYCGVWASVDSCRIAGETFTELGG